MNSSGRVFISLSIICGSLRPSIECIQPRSITTASAPSRSSVANHEPRYQTTADDPGPACHEHPHNDHLPESRTCLWDPKLDSLVICDAGTHAGWGLYKG